MRADTAGMSNVSHTAANPPAGWYHDPQEPSVLRYWDGDRWTTDMQPAPQRASAQPEPWLTNRVAIGIVVGLLIVATLIFL